MREIKFRAYGNYPYKMFIPKEIVIVGDSIHSVYDEEGNRYVPEIPLMQYTGLKDKNGKEVYEGDYVYATTRGMDFETKFAVIRWSDYLKCVVVYSKDTDIDDCLPIGRFYELEVIGNIHENPELLNKDGK